MRKRDVRVGRTYEAKFWNEEKGSYTLHVRIDRKAESMNGGWWATDVETGKPVRIMQGGRLTREIDANGDTVPLPPATPRRTRRRTKQHPT